MANRIWVGQRGLRLVVGEAEFACLDGLPCDVLELLDAVLAIEFVHHCGHHGVVADDVVQGSCDATREGDVASRGVVHARLGADGVGECEGGCVHLWCDVTHDGESLEKCGELI